MSETIREKHLEIDFDDSWKALKYDESPFFRNGPQKLQQVKGVDILCLSNDKAVYLLELKDSRGYDKGEEIAHLEQLVPAITKKVHDTLAGITGASRSEQNQLWREVAQSMVDGSNNLFIVACVDRDNLIGRYFPFFKTLESQLKSKLGWLSCKVLITTSDELNEVLPGTVVRSNPRIGLQ